jgi:CRISPR/Cas system CSM-associated protein Csm2 small subunit
MAVSQHLGSMAFNFNNTMNRSHQPNGSGLNEVLQKMLNPQVQTNLDNLIQEQMQQIQAMN